MFASAEAGSKGQGGRRREADELDGRIVSGFRSLSPNYGRRGFRQEVRRAWSLRSRSGASREAGSPIKISNPRDRNFHLGAPRWPVENGENATFAFCVPVHTALAGAGPDGADGSGAPSQDGRSGV